MGKSLVSCILRHSVRQAAKLVAAVLRVARVTVGLAESNGSLAQDSDRTFCKALKQFQILDAKSKLTADDPDV